MALEDTRGGREYGKFIADGSGETGIRVITGAHETISANSGTVNITSTDATIGAVVLAAQDVTGKERIGVQCFNEGAVTATFKVWASLKASPGTPIANIANWTQIGDNIEVTAANDNAYKAIATTPMKWLYITAYVASSNADCLAYILVD